MRFNCCYYEKWIAWTDFNLIVFELITRWEEVSPLYGLEKLLLAQVPLEPFCLDLPHLPKCYHSTSLFLDHVGFHINCVVDFLVQVYHKGVLAYQDNVFLRKVSELPLGGTDSRQHMVDTTRVKVENDDFVIFLFSTKVQSFFKISRVLVRIMQYINIPLMVISPYLLLNPIKIANHTPNLFGIPKLRLIYLISPTVNQNHVLTFSL